MSQITPPQFEKLLPLAHAWAEAQERLILQTGVPLTEPQMADAKLVGVAHPELVRVLQVSEIPTPDDPALAKAAEITSLIGPETIGFTIGYGIFIRSDHWGERRLMVHELTHAMQFERLGGMAAFLRQYLTECVSVGYPAAPLEQEALRVEREMCP